MSENVLEKDVESSLIKRVIYNPDTLELTLIFHPKYFLKEQTYTKVPPDYFHELVNANSCGNFYTEYIKPVFKTKKQIKMAETEKKPQLPTKNLASSKWRDIDMSINLSILNKKWLKAGDKGLYANIRLRLMPDGTIDKYGNLGFILQQVPSEIYKAEKDLPKEQKTKNIILGNGKEIDWQAVNGNGGHIPDGEPTAEEIDDLPF